jgi:carbonic anhydrase/acetyltransferase-like protein (isoleucine patch superfamily)
MPLFAIGERRVRLLGDHHYVAHDATLVGDITLHNEVSVWFQVVIRAENDRITIGEKCNIQDGSVLHVDPGYPLTLGSSVSIGHKVMLHGCTIGDGALIGVAAIVLNSAVIGKDCLVGAGSVVTEGKSFPDRSVIFGSPAKVARQVTEDNIMRMRFSAESYVLRGRYFKQHLKRIG